MNASHTTLQFNGYNAWLVILLALLAGYLIVKLYHRETEAYLKAGARLRALRAAVAMILVMLLSQPVIHTVSAQYQKPTVILLRDRSSSMKVKDSNEPVERRLRAAVSLGLLDDKLRDTHHSQAAQAMAGSQTALEGAVTGIQQALQLLQESAANLKAAEERIRVTCRLLASVSSAAAQAGAILKSAPSVSEPGATGSSASPEQQATADQFSQTADRIGRELGDMGVNGSAVTARLLDKEQLLNGFKLEFTKFIDDLRMDQDRMDRALGESGNPVVKAALEHLGAMDRKSIVTSVLNGKSVSESGSLMRVVVYDFDTELRTIPQPAMRDSEASDQSDQPVFSLFHPTGSRIDATALETVETDLATPLLQVSERHAQDSITAVVMCTDGRHTTGPVPEDAARLLSARGIEFHILGVGCEIPPQDICVARLDGTLSVFLEETIRLTAHIKVAGCKGKKCTLTLQLGDQIVQQRELKLEKDGWLQETFDFAADKPGSNLFIATIKPIVGEVMTDNNSAETVVDVANDRLKVLLVDETPRWETRYIASLLRRERKMTLDENWLLVRERLGLPLQVIPDEQTVLDAYEIVVLGDIDPKLRLSERDQQHLSSYVSDNGGFLVLVAGPDAMPRSYITGPIAELLPVKNQAPTTASASTGGGGYVPGRVGVKLDPAGIRNEITQILRNPKLNQELWPALPKLEWVARPAYPKPGATVLLTTDDARKDVVVAVQNFGAGRVLYIGTDDTWRWRDKVADRVHAFFWSQAMRWGTSNRLSGGPRLKAGLDRRQIRPGENIEIVARPRDAQGLALSGAMVIAELLNKAGEDEAVSSQTLNGLAVRRRIQRVQLQAVPDSGGLYRGSLEKISLGTHTIRVRVEAPGFEGVSQDLQVISRDLVGQEGVELGRDTARLTAMAQAGSGRYLDILDAPQLFAQLGTQGKYHNIEISYELWSSYPVLGLIVLLLSLEWVLRKRAGLA